MELPPVSFSKRNEKRHEKRTDDGGNAADVTLSRQCPAKTVAAGYEANLHHYEISDTAAKFEESDSIELIQMFISAKRIEGCSEKTLKYYRPTINAMVYAVDKNIRHIITEDLRTHLTGCQSRNQSSRVTIDNIRRVLSSFFSWLEDEDYIVKSPVRHIHKVKTMSGIKES